MFFVGKQIQACLHLQQTLSIEAWPQCVLASGIKTLTSLGYTVTGAISRRLKLTFNDYVKDKKINWLTHK